MTDVKYIRILCLAAALSMAVVTFAQAPAPAPAAAPEAAPAAAKGPKIASDEPIFNYGERKSSEDVEHEFIIKNTGDEKLIISEAKPTCGCTDVKVAKMELEPGEQTSVHAKLKLAGRQGENKKYINVKCNDPDPDIQKMGFRLGFEGSVIAPVMYDPTMINFGQVMDDKPLEGVVTFWAGYPDTQLKILDIDLTEAPGIATEIKTVEENKKYQVIVRPTEPFPAGTIKKFIKVKTNLDELQPTRIGVFGQMVEQLLIQPPEINMYYYEDDPELYKDPYYMSVGPGRVKEFTLNEVTSDVPDLKVEFLKMSGNFYRLTLTNLPQKASLNGKTLTLHTDIPGAEEVKVKCISECFGKERPAALK